MEIRTGQWGRLVLAQSAALLFAGVAAAAPAPKATICHFPPGNPANVQVLTVGAAALPAHVTQHHDAVCAAGDGNCCFGGPSPSLCTNFQTDVKNCGACGVTCPAGSTCSGGTCVSICAPGTIDCGGTCVDPNTDRNNCGACGNACPAGDICAAGVCTCPTAGQTNCSGTCTDTGTDRNNCGACENACPAGDICAAGACTCPAAGETNCSGTCTDTGTDPNNCGGCGTVCPAGASCTSGQCTCPSGTTLCNGACVDENTDPNNCGACGNACAPGASCTGGSCQNVCPGGTTLCAGRCVNESTDPNNCGACGNMCGSGTTCTGGSCQSTCPPGFALCSNGACVNQNTDLNNCGSCGTVCAVGNTCTGGTCVLNQVAGSCLPTSSLGVLIQGSAPAATVTAYVPRGSWDGSGVVPLPDVIVVPLEPAVGPPTVVATGNPVNSCSSNSVTGLTVCTGNANDVYVLSGTTLVATLTADGTGSQNFSGGFCVTCGVATDASTGLAWLAEGTSTSTGQLQSLNPATSVFGAPLDLFGQLTSENVSVDPVRHLILSALENGNFQIIDTRASAVFNSAVSFAPLELDSTAEDCSTGIALAPAEFSVPPSIVLADLSQATFTPGSPGTWSAPTTVQSFPDFSHMLAAGPSAIAVAPGSHLAGVTDEFGGAAFGVVELPATSGVGAPSAVDYVAANVPNDPAGVPWSMGLDPHPMTAYTSPNTGRAILAISNVTRTYLALVDMQALLLPTLRTPGTHTVDPSVDLVALGIVTFVAE